MKKILALLALVFTVSLLASCSDTHASSPIKENGDSHKIQVVATIFPQYDWAKQVIADNDENFELTLLLGNGIDLHSYEPSVQDMALISTCDVFIYAGGESDEWVDDALKTVVNEDMVVINLLELLGDEAKVEQIKEGMEHDHDHDEGDDPDHGTEADNHVDDTHSGDGLDEHVWLSLQNAEIFVAEFANMIATLDPDNTEAYQSNASSYIEELHKLDEEYAEAVRNASYDTLLFGDRFPFRYLVDDYGLDYYAAFPGCSAEAEASFETIIFLSNKLDELKLPSVFTIETSDQSIARTIIDNSEAKNQEILVLNSMQSITLQDSESGTTYLSLMKDNLEVLRQAL